MKALIPAVLAVACIAVLIAGQVHWKDKISAATGSSVEAPKEVEKTKTESLSDPIVNLAANWPEDSVKNFKEAIEEDKPFKIQIVGSTALGKGPDSWPEMVKAALLEAYGEERLEVSILSYDLNSLEFISQNKQDDLLESPANMIILEPFTLKNNGEVSIEHSFKHLKTIMDAVKRESPETTFLLQPPHPLYNAEHYPNQVAELKKYAAENNIPYLDHWTEWPDQTKEEFKEYLSKDNSQPSNKGHKIWAYFLMDYLIDTDE